MKLYTTQEIRTIERHTCQTVPLTPGQLRERYADAVATEICARWRPNKPTMVLAGPGRNGAEALAVAGQLYLRGFKPQVFLFNIGGDKLSAEGVEARDTLAAQNPDIEFFEITGSFNLPSLTRGHLVVDGMFGPDEAQELQGGFLSMVQYINEEAGATVVSLQVPSGMFGDWNPQIVNRNVVHASLTLTSQYPRLCFFMADNAPLIGQWRALDIGLDDSCIPDRDVSNFFTDRGDIARRLRRRGEFSHKGDFGHGLLFAGSYGMMGAAVLAATGALRGGIGLLTVDAPKCGCHILQTTVPEALYRYNRGDLNIVDIHPANEFSAVAVGPGIGTHELTVKAVCDFLAAMKNPVILDADALNCIAAQPTILGKLPILSVLTPHPGEFDRLFGPQPTAEMRLRKAVEMARYYNVIIVLKGHYTAVVRPDSKIFFNSSGTAALATPGSGDVLTGLLLALMAQGYAPEQAALIGVYIHGLAGEIAAADQGEYGVLASDVADNIGRAIRAVMSSNNKS